MQISPEDRIFKDIGEMLRVEGLSQETLKTIHHVREKAIQNLGNYPD